MPEDPAPPTVHRSRTVRMLLWIAGSVSLVLGVIGVILPGLPTTPFILLAASFRQSTAVLAEETQAGRPLSGLRDTPRMMAAAGGLPIEGGGSFFGAIAVSGAPGGDADEACAQAGVDAIAEAIEF